MLSKVKTVALDGMEGVLVEIETDISNNLPYFNIIGMADTSVREASDRVKRAIINSGYKYPKGKITVNLSPAYMHKKGSHYDLGIAIGVLLADGSIECSVQETLFIGELSLGGEVLPSRAVLPMVMSILDNNVGNFKEIILSIDNCPECYLLTKGTNIKLIPVRTLRETIGHLNGSKIQEYLGERTKDNKIANSIDFLDVKGQNVAKEAIITAIAGNHNLLMIGPPGSGKSMLARRVSTILPKMTLEEKIETTKIYSYAGKLSVEQPIINERPFRHMTPNVTAVSLLGGGNIAMPGEVSFAHNGILFLDEMLEFPSRALEQLRVPLSDKKINLVRKGKSVVFPAKFILIGATNPCRCGFLGDPNQACICTQTEINQYRSKLSGPLADRIDMAVEIQRVNYNELEGRYDEAKPLSSKDMNEIIMRAREVQTKRYKDCPYSSNGDVSNKDITKYCELDMNCQKFMENIYNEKHISPRRYHKILRIARTIADINQENEINIQHLATAFHYTRFLSERGVQG